MENKILKLDKDESFIIVNNQNIAVLEITYKENGLIVKEPLKIKYVENVKLKPLKNKSC